MKFSGFTQRFVPDYPWLRRQITAADDQDANRLLPDVEKQPYADSPLDSPPLSPTLQSDARAIKPRKSLWTRNQSFRGGLLKILVLGQAWRAREDGVVL